MTIFRRVLSDDQVEDAVRTTLKKWIDTELRIVEEDAGLDSRHYERPRSWEIHSDMDKWPEEQLPAVIIVTLGVVDTAKEGSGKIRATWQINVTNIVSSRDLETTRKWALRLGTAVRASLVHRQSLDGALPTGIPPQTTVRGVKWDSSSNRELPLDADRTLWGVRQTFNIEIGDVLTQSAGPAKPDDPPPDPYPVPIPDWPVVPDREHVIINTLPDS